MIGPRPNLLGRVAGTHKRLEVDQPVLTNADLAKIRSVEESLDGAFRTETIDMTWDANVGRCWPRNGAEGNVLGRDRSSACRQEHPDPV